ncbi:hypothetical protein ACKX2L_05960 [Lachnospiraceae bacterium YH-ros2228]
MAQAMVITMTKMDKKGKNIRLRTDDLRIQSYVASQKTLFQTMQIIARDVNRLGETAEFVIDEDSFKQFVIVR